MDRDNLEKFLAFWLFIAIMFWLFGCSIPNQMCKDNDRTLRVVCNDVFGYDFESKERLSSLEGRVNKLEENLSKDNNLLISTINNLSYLVDSNNTNLQNQVDNILSSLYLYSNSLSQLENSISLLENNDLYLENLIDLLQEEVYNNTNNIAELQGYSNIEELIDPCGDAPNKYDEVFIRLNTGELLASFSDNNNGKNTRLSLIRESDTTIYQTTDSTNCSFKVPSSGGNKGKVCYGSGFNICS